MLKKVTPVLALMLAAGAASADLYLNEVFRNPAGGSDNQWQMIELFGCGGQDLSGKAVVCVISDRTGGSGTLMDPYTYDDEVDESFYIPLSSKFKTNGNGFFCIWWSSSTASSTNLHTCANNSSVYGLFPVAGGAGGMQVADNDGSFDLNDADFDLATSRYEVCNSEIDIDNFDTPGTIKSSDSLTVLLIDVTAWRSAFDNHPSHKTSLGGDGDTLTEAEAKIILAKDAEWDHNDDGNASTGNAAKDSALSILYSTAGLIIDEVAISNDGGQEFTKEEANEIDFTPNSYTPDVISRVKNVANNYVGGGRKIKDLTTGVSDDYRDAYTEWANGDIGSNTTRLLVQGFGGVVVPNANAAQPVLVRVGPASTDVGSFHITYGTANESINKDHVDGANDFYVGDSDGEQITAAGCGGGLRFDRDGDGFVTVSDVRILLQGGDSAGALEAARLINN